MVNGEQSMVNEYKNKREKRDDKCEKSSKQKTIDDKQY